MVNPSVQFNIDRCSSAMTKPVRVSPAPKPAAHLGVGVNPQRRSFRQSPLWMLSACVVAISAALMPVVDITNYVMLELGHQCTQSISPRSRRHSRAYGRKAKSLVLTPMARKSALRADTLGHCDHERPHPGQWLASWARGIVAVSEALGLFSEALFRHYRYRRQGPWLQPAHRFLAPLLSVAWIGSCSASGDGAVRPL